MNKQEIGNMLAVLCVYYPANKVEVNELTINAWWAMFHDKQNDEVLKAVKSFVATDTSGFFPNPGKILAQLAQLKTPECGMSEHEAFALVDKAVCNGIWSSVEEFDKLPKSIQSIVGSPSQIKQWAVIDRDKFMTVVASNFMRSWREKVQNNKRNEMLPSDVRAFAESYRSPALGRSFVAEIGDVSSNQSAWRE